MSKFKRIVREALVMGGQARIRDTGITVNEIVRLSLDGKSQAEILEDFPQLEAEDVHQALGYSMDTSASIQANWRYWINRNLNARMNLELHLDMPDEFSTPEEILESIKIGIASMQIAATELDYTDTLTSINGIKAYENYKEKISIDLNVIFSHDLLFPDESIYISASTFHTIRVVKPEILSPVMFTAQHHFEYLIKLLALREIKNLVDGEPIPNIVILEGDCSIHFMITRRIKLGDTGTPLYLKEAIFGIASTVSIASYMLYQAGSELKVELVDDKIIFEFSLPIVEDNTG